jgi:hypothetical protein
MTTITTITKIIVNQGSAHMERESKKPQYEQDYRDSPKHGSDDTVGAEI